ncbi:hypothetical protein Tco_0105919 [Tanacetum coccineum]
MSNVTRLLSRWKATSCNDMLWELQYYNMFRKQMDRLTPCLCWFLAKDKVRGFTREIEMGSYCESRDVVENVVENESHFSLEVSKGKGLLSPNGERGGGKLKGPGVEEASNLGRRRRGVGGGVWGLGGGGNSQWKEEREVVLGVSKHFSLEFIVCIDGRCVSGYWRGWWGSDVVVPMVCIVKKGLRQRGRSEGEKEAKKWCCTIFIEVDLGPVQFVGPNSDVINHTLQLELGVQA